MSSGVKVSLEGFGFSVLGVLVGFGAIVLALVALTSDVDLLSVDGQGNKCVC